MKQSSKPNIAILFGGISPEHEVSIITGIQILNALDQDKYNSIPIYVSKTGEWYRLNPQKINVKDFVNIPLLTSSNPKVALTTDPTVKGIIRVDQSPKIHLRKIQRHTKRHYY